MLIKALFDLVKNTKGICIDSRKIESEECFFSFQSPSHDTSIFIKEALSRNAVFVVTNHPRFQEYKNVIYIKNIKEAFSYCAHKFYFDIPKYKIAITGTNGKTSTVDYVRKILILLNQKAASIGTMGLLCNTDISESTSDLATLTSNDLITNYKILTALKAQDVNYISLEASSIGIDQNRLGRIKFCSAAFTSFSQDHLDYHGDMENYLKIKLNLFRHNLDKKGTALISDQVMQIISESNVKIPLKAGQNLEIIGENKFCDVQISVVNNNFDGQKINFQYKNQTYSFNTKIITKNQAYNLVFAALSVFHCGFDLKSIVQILHQVQPVAGRMQKVLDPLNLRHIFIDYAHDPSSIKNALLELHNLRPSKKTKIFCIVGCGGQRDKLKRPLIGQVLSQFTDCAIITDDNPRNEDPKSIRSEIISGIFSHNYIEIGDRQNAIKYALKNMNKDDILLVAGKGHEKFQIYGDDLRPFNDLDVTIKCLLE